MSRVAVHVTDPFVVLEVDGALDAVAAYDLRQTFAVALSTSTGVVALDLSRVTGVDDDGVRALHWCSKRAIAAQRPLVWSQCSTPLLRALQVHTLARRPVSPAGRAIVDRRQAED